MSNSNTKIDDYMTSNEEISFILTHRPTGFSSWLKSMLGIGVTKWYLTDQRLIEHRDTAGGFDFQDMSLDQITSVEYGKQLNLSLIIVSVLLGVVGLMLLLASTAVGFFLLLIGGALGAYVFYGQQQTLAVHGPGSVELALSISRGQRVDDFLWYVHAERQKAAK